MFRLRNALLPVLIAGAICAPGMLGAQDAPPPNDPPVEPGDRVAIRIWEEEELSGEFLVDQHHRVTIPIVGELDVTGETELSLRERVRQALRREIRNPSIEVLLMKRVRVLGPVVEPGIVYVDGTMSVADALASVGGRGPDARTDYAYLRRGGELIRTDLFQDTRLSDLSIRTGDEILVPTRSWLDRNSAALISGAAGTLGIIIGLLIR